MNKEITYDYIQKNIQVLKDNEIYRISDLLKKYKTEKIVQELLDNEKYKDTIIRNYFLTNPTPCFNLNHLINCITYYIEENNIHLFSKNELVVHIRAGDAYDLIGIGNKEIRSNMLHNINAYIKKRKNIKQIIIVSALHYGHSKESEYYDSKRWIYDRKNVKKNIIELESFFKELPLPAKLISNENIDIDFALLTHCKHLIHSNGGFSKLVKYLNDTIHNRPSLFNNLYQQYIIGSDNFNTNFEFNTIKQFIHQRDSKITNVRKNIYDEVIKSIPKPENIPVFNTSGRLIIVLIEYRDMPEIDYVINAMLRVYDSTEIGFAIVHGTKNNDSIQKNYGHWENIKLINTGDENISRHQYSQMLKTPQFYEQFLDWSHLLIYQTDALIMRKVHDVYFDYDYIGSPWNISWTRTPAGNGGFSLRNVKAMIKVCEVNRNIKKEDISTLNEDVFFCYHEKELKYPSFYSMTHWLFSVECVVKVIYTIGCHKVYAYSNNMSNDIYNVFINYIKQCLIENNPPDVPNECYTGKK